MSGGILDPTILELRRKLAAEALDGIAWQAGAAARMLANGDDGNAIECFRRVMSLARHASPELMILASALGIATDPGVSP